VSARDDQLAHVAKRYGANYSARIIIEARRTKHVSISLGFGLIEQESKFQNIYGHDGVPNPIKSPPNGVLKVTKANYAEYKRHRKAGEGMQGVGPPQITWYELQDKADRYGGCWIARWSIRVGFEHLNDLIEQHGPAAGIAAYNGSGAAAQHYSRVVRARAARWHEIFTKEA
jgi:hypothetical protein